MKPFWKATLCVALLLFAGAAFGQTTGSISGIVTAANESTALPGAVVTAVHEPTGTRYTAVTRNDGRFAILNVRVGGPYNIEVEMAGFKPADAADQFVRLGEDLFLKFSLQLEEFTETVNVVDQSDALINPSRTGAASNVSEYAIENLPTVGRGLEDFARLNPFFSVNPDNDADSRLTVAGRNNRYNNISIDGSVNNDLFGLAGSGVPGGQTLTQPISLDAIQELQLLVAPFDVRQGGFTGGGINAITRSGTNDWAASAYYFTRDDSYVGDGPDFFSELGTFSDDQYGFRLGGPIKKDKFFFFVNGEISEQDQPSGFSIGGASGQDFAAADPRLVADANRFRDILINQYGFDPGGLEQETLIQDSDKYFARFDFNLNESNQLTVRHNYVDASKTFLRPDNFDYEFPSHTHIINSETNSTVAQLNTVIGANMFNELRITNQTIKDRRTPVGQPFPYIIVRVSAGRDFEAGSERFSTANALDQDIVEITNDFTWVKNRHTLTFGTHNELFSFRNLFIRENFGSYIFSSLDALEAGVARQFDHSFSQTGDPQEAAKFDVTSLAFYVNDQWTVRDNLTLTLGLRVDIPLFPDDPSRNPVSEQFFGLRTDTTPDGNTIISPRVGFNWDINGNGKQQLRGGIGIFAGRSPYVWLSNQYSNTGIEFGRLRATGSIPFNPNPFGQPTSFGGLFTNEIDLIDPDFELPHVLRYNIAYDRELPWWGLTGSVEFIYSENVEEILYQNLNIVPTGQVQPFDGRPIFTTLDPQFTDVIFLTNTSQGDQTSLAVKIEKPFRNGWSGFVSYTYNDSEVVSDGTSSQAVSNWRFNEVQGDPNNPTLGVSDFAVEDRFNLSFSYQFNRRTRWPTTVSAFFNAQSGRNYATTYAFDFTSSINGDGNDNDLIYVPSGPDDVIITNGTWEDLNAYISIDNGLDNARGSIVERNASRAPWVHQWDVKFAQDIPIKNQKIQITLDILNFWNLFDDESGLVRYVPFSEVSPVTFRGVDAATGKPIYELGSVVFNPDQRFVFDDLRSRWQAKLGVRWTF